MAAVTKVKNAKKRSGPPQSENTNGLPEVLEVNDEADLEKGESNGDENGDEQAEMRIKKEEMVEENDDLEEGEVIGIITLEDVMEELLQEEIVDETDEYIDVHNKVRVAAAAAQMMRGGSLVRRVGSIRNQQLGLSKQGQHAVNRYRQVEKEARLDHLATHGTSNNLSEPLLSGKSGQ